MGNLIGYKDNSEERMANWLTMQMLKQSEEVFGNSTDERERKVLEQDRRIYSNFLSKYVQ